MSHFPKRLSELEEIKYDSIDDTDTNVSPKKNPPKPVKLMPKRLQELYLDSFDSDDFDDSVDCVTELDRSSGFDESEIANEASLEVSSSTPIGKENDKNYFNRNEKDGSSVRRPFSEHANDVKLTKHENDKKLMDTTKNREAAINGPVKTETSFKEKKGVHFAYDSDTTKALLEPRSLLFSPIEALQTTSRHQINNIQSVDNFFDTPSIKPPLTTGRIIFSSSLQKNRLPRQLNSNYKKTLFTTPQPLINRPCVSNTSDYVTDSFNSVKQTPCVLSPIDEEKISIDDFHSLSAVNDDGTALLNKIIEINRKDYVIKQKIGSGGSCFVHLIQCKNNGKDCALKVVNLKTDASNVESYLNETKLLQKLQGNDCVIKLFEYLHRPEKFTLFLVMELGESDLNKVLKSYQSDLPLNRIISYWHQMLTAVKYIHDNGVIHSDLKPANFLLVNGRLKLIDFGIASNISMDATSIFKFSQTGTLNYISPEALIDVSSENTPKKKNKYKISTKSDVWSLGCIFYLCVYRRTPFSHIKNFYSKFAAITNTDTEIDYPPLPMYYPPMLLEIIRKCLQFDPKTRSSVAELLNYPLNLVNDSIL